MTMLPGPVSNATTSSSVAFGGMNVTLAMPPMFCMRAREFRMTQLAPIEVRDERRAVTARGDVAHAQIAHRDDAGALGDDGGLSDRERGARRDRLIEPRQRSASTAPSSDADDARSSGRPRR